MHFFYRVVNNDPGHPARYLALTKLIHNSKGKGGRGRVQGKGEGPLENWEKVQVLWIHRGAGVVPSSVLWGIGLPLPVENDRQWMFDISH